MTDRRYELIKALDIALTLGSWAGDAKTRAEKIVDALDAYIATTNEEAALETQDMITDALDAADAAKHGF